ncbi:MAG: flagellar motor switch protein FliG [Methylomicrobium sp.]
MRAKIILSGLLSSRLVVCDALPAADAPAPVFGNLMSNDLTLWSVSLLAIFGVLSFGFWGFRKFSGFNTHATDKMRVSARLSLGLREKVVLLQAGNKQLILGITPGKIQTLHVLDQNDCLITTEKAAKTLEEAVALRLKAEIPTLTEANSLTGNSGGASAGPFSRTEPKVQDCSPRSITQSYEKHSEYVRRLVDQNPKLAAQTLKAWISDDGAATANLFKGVERASLLLLTLGQERASEVLKHLELGDMELLGSSMASMKNVSLGAVDGVLDQFIGAVNEQAALGGDPEEYTRSVLANALGAEKAEAIIDRVVLGGRNRGIHYLKRMNAGTIADLVRTEHPQIVANLLCLLEEQQAADVIMALPEELRSNLLMRIAALEGVSPAALRELDEILEEQWAANQQNKSSVVRGVNVAGTILKRLDVDVSSQLLEDIFDNNVELAQKIQDKLFVFEELLNLNDRGMQTLLREISSEQLLLALKGTSEELKSKIFSNMSKRTAEMLRDDLEAAPPAKAGEIESAQKEILLIVRNLAGSGSVVFGGDERAFN